MTDEFDDDDLDLDEEPSPARRIAGVALPIATTIVALGVGGLVGGGLVALFQPDPTVVEIARDLSNEELDAVCAPKVDEAVAEAADTIEGAQDQVRTLEAQVAAKQEEVEALEAEMGRRAEKGRDLARAVERARRELADLEGRLERAIEEKEALVVELTHTREEVEIAQMDARSFKWRSFVQEAELSVCERGGRKRMGRCRETVAAALGPMVREHFEHCIQSGQEIPSLVEGERNAELPEFSQWLDQDNRITRGWYVRLCDPSLPEPTHFQSVDAQETVDEVFAEDDPDAALEGFIRR